MAAKGVQRPQKHTKAAKKSVVMIFWLSFSAFFCQIVLFIRNNCYLCPAIIKRIALYLLKFSLEL